MYFGGAQELWVKLAIAAMQNGNRLEDVPVIADALLEKCLQKCGSLPDQRA